MNVSVIIVNFNTKHDLQRCIESIYREAGNTDYEIIVVDNASSDGSAEMVRSRFPKVTLIVEHINRGYAAGINKGIEAAKGRYVLALNSDVVIHDAAVEKAARYADEHPKAAVVGCQVRESSDNVQMTCFRFPSLLNLFLNCSGLAQAFKYNHFFGREAMLWWRRDSEREVDVVSGMFMLVRSEAIRQVGLLDEDYFLYFEETDWCYRFSRDGWKIVFWPGAGITHVDGGGHSTCQSALKMFIRFTKSLLLFFKKHKGPIQCFIARFTLAVSFGVRWGIWTITKFMRNITGKDSGYAEGKSQQSWAAFKFCAFGVEH